MIKKVKKAMTLVELIISMAILAIVMGATSTFFISSYGNLNKAEDKADLQKAVQDVIDEFSDNVLNGESISLSNGTDHIELVDSTSGDIGFTLKDTSTINYRVANNNFEKTSGETIASNIQSISVDKLDGGEGIKVKATAVAGEEVESLETNLYFRREIAITIEGVDDGSGGDEDPSGDDSGTLTGDLVFYAKKTTFDKNLLVNAEGIIYVNNNIVLNSARVEGAIVSKGKVDVKGWPSQLTGNIYADGNVSITQNSDMIGNIETNGKLTATGGDVSINGNVFAKEKIEIDSAEIGGDVGTDKELDIKGWSPYIKGNVYSKEDMNISQGSKIEKDVLANGELILDGGSVIVGGNASAKKEITINSAQIGGDVSTDDELIIQGWGTYIKGNAYAKGNLDIKQGSIIEKSVKTDGSLLIDGSDVVISGSAYSDGDVSITNGSKVMGSLYTNGKTNMTESNTLINGNLYSDGDVSIKNGGIVMQDVNTDGKLSLDRSDTLINGSAYSDGDVSMKNDSRVKGNVHTNGKIDMYQWDTLINGYAYADGDITIKNGDLSRHIKGEVATNGKLTVENNEQEDSGRIVTKYIYNDKYDKNNLTSVASYEGYNGIDLPEYQIDIRDEDWFTASRGYEVLDNKYNSTYQLTQGSKIYISNNYNRGVWVNSAMDIENIVVVSEKDISITSNKAISGVLIADRNITLNVPKFTGVIIAKGEFTSNYNSGGNAEINLVNMDSYFSSSDEYPCVINKNE